MNYLLPVIINNAKGIWIITIELPLCLWFSYTLSSFPSTYSLWTSSSMYKTPKSVTPSQPSSEFLTAGHLHLEIHTPTSYVKPHSPLSTALLPHSPNLLFLLFPLFHWTVLPTWAVPTRSTRIPLYLLLVPTCSSKQSVSCQLTLKFYFHSPQTPNCHFVSPKRYKSPFLSIIFLATF